MNETSGGADYPPSPPPGYPQQPPAYTPPSPPPGGYSQWGYPPAGYGPYGPQAYYPGPMPPSTNSLAIASVILAFVFPIAAIILGHIALGQINNSRGAQEGRGLAIAGLILGYTFTAASLFFILLILTAVATHSNPNGLILPMIS